MEGISAKLCENWHGGFRRKTLCRSMQGLGCAGGHKELYKMLEREGRGRGEGEGCDCGDGPPPTRALCVNLPVSVCF